MDIRNISEACDEMLTEYQQLYSIVAVFDHTLSLVSASATYQRHMTVAPDASSQFFDLFRVHRPNRVQTIDVLRQRASELFLLIANHCPFAIRGQFVVRPQAQGDFYILLGAPWFEWIRKNYPHVNLTMSDFSKSDPQLDMLFLMSSNDAQMRDLEELADELRQARDQAVAAKKQRSEFFAVMSHEMRTPLNGVIGATELLVEQPATLEQLPLIHTANQSAKHLLDVINHVLDFSKLEAGKLQCQLVEFDQAQLLNDVVSICQPRASEKNLQLDSVISAKQPLHCLGDVIKIRQVLINLVGNAIKFTHEGSVTLSLHTIASADTHSRYRYAVKDTGIGINEVDQKRLFDVFWAVQDNNVADASTGLGLNISKQIVDAMGGLLCCESTVGAGTEFYFELVLEHSKTQPTTAALTKPQELELDPHNVVLLVDDNATNVLLGKLMLEKLGIQVDVASNGLEAVNKAQQSSFDLILMDVSMPIMGGVEAMTKIQSLLPNYPPIVALTAHASDADRSHLLAQGMDDYLSKPIERHALNVVLAKYLKPAKRSEIR